MTFVYEVAEPGTTFILSRWLIGLVIILIMEIPLFLCWRKADADSSDRGPTKTMWMGLMLAYLITFLCVTVVILFNTGWNFAWKII